MGMFDIVLFEKSPVKCECGHQPTDFQTKSRDNYLETYLITDKTVELEDFDLVAIPKEKMKNRRFPRFNRVNKGYRKLEDSGHIDCYTGCDKCEKHWWDICILFKNGNIIGTKIYLRK